MPAMIGAAHLSVCHEQARLLEARSKAADLYADAARHLAEYKRKLHTRDDYEARVDAVKHARAEVERAREAFNNHRREHGY
jgi:hypothetical protein